MILKNGELLVLLFWRALQCLYWSSNIKQIKVSNVQWPCSYNSLRLQQCCTFLSSLKAVIRPTPVWKIWRLTCALTQERNRTCVNMKAVTKPSPMLLTGPNTRTELTPMRYCTRLNGILTPDLICCYGFIVTPMLLHWCSTHFIVFKGSTDKWAACDWKTDFRERSPFINLNCFLFPLPISFLIEIHPYFIDIRKYATKSLCSFHWDERLHTFCVLFYRNPMYVRSLAVLSGTQIQAPCVNMWRLCTALKPTSPKSIVEIQDLDLQVQP